MLHKWIDYISVNDINKPKDFTNIWCFNELSGGDDKPTLDLYESMFKILGDPLFDPIRESIDFKSIVARLKSIADN
ncbi:transcriptional regulator, partial [Clostridium tyrobutyricum]|nr:transcriptional regulator [Clostridium tyrobutyricum]